MSEESGPALFEESARVLFPAPVRELAAELAPVPVPVLSRESVRERGQALVAMRVSPAAPVRYWESAARETDREWDKSC